MALFPECTAQCSSKELDTADIVRDGDIMPTSKDKGNPAPPPLINDCIMKSAVQRPSRIFRVVVSRSVNLVLPVAVFWMFSAGVTGSARAQTFSVLYNFVNGADGASPDRGSLVL